MSHNRWQVPDGEETTVPRRLKASHSALRAALAVGVAFGFVALPAVFLAQPLPRASNDCDRSLPIDGRDPLRYRQRGEHCEGRHGQLLSQGGAAFPLRSFLHQNSGSIPSRTDTIRVAWEAPASADVIHLRATALHPPIRYRMDERRIPSDATYAWSTELLDRLRLKPQQLGYVAFASETSEQSPYFIPLTLGGSTTSSPLSRHSLVFEPPRSYYFVSISIIEENSGRLARSWFSDRRVFARAPLEITLDSLPPGLLRLELRGMYAGGSQEETVRIYVPPPLPADSVDAKFRLTGIAGPNGY